MKLYQKIIAGGLVVAGLAGLLGCDSKNNQSPQRQEKTKATYFKSVPMWYETGMALANGDFDGDGDLDIIVGAGKLDAVGRLYLLQNIGNGKFNEPINFGSVPMWYETGMSLTVGDFDGDGDLDIIVGAGKLDAVGRLYLFKNDGEGNFSQ